jgi:hypothetical protein
MEGVVLVVVVAAAVGIIIHPIPRAFCEEEDSPCFCLSWVEEELVNEEELEQFVFMLKII